MGPEWCIFRISLLRVTYRQMTSRFPPLQILLNELSLLYEIMATACNFFFVEWRRSNCVFSTDEDAKTENSEKRRKRFQETPWNLTRKQKFLAVFMRPSHIPKLKITFFSEVLVFLLHIRPFRTLTFYNVLVRHGSSVCNRARLNFQAFTLRDIKWWPEKAFT